MEISAASMNTNTQGFSSNTQNAATPTSSSPVASPSYTKKSDAASGSSMNSWKVIGIGVLAFAGIVMLVLGTAFQDSIVHAICSPFRHSKAGSEEVLVPDWRRGSWNTD
ncbi:uncharacterized protein FOMMEDRAFT_23557, partial [Fomitiporia mediterranea MF3/22]|uniref:uncharacterized protein n=1 Tax=Fomitiporia mediterranea (strain MF3/22) TaxID=694068 RepID=UPI0004409452